MDITAPTERIVGVNQYFVILVSPAIDLFIIPNNILLKVVPLCRSKSKIQYQFLHTNLNLGATILKVQMIHYISQNFHNLLDMTTELNLIYEYLTG
jgi:hypothetical protein